MLLVGILTGLIILVFLVVIHELGHAIVARRNGVVVEEFGIGFPPKAWGKKIKQSILGSNVLLSINWLPLGGFVKLQGEHDSASKEGDYGAATYWQKTRILLAGVLINWVAAAVIFTLLAFVGLPKILPNQFSVPSDTVTSIAPLTVSFVEKDSPAAKAGLKSGDEIILIGTNEIESSAELSEETKRNKGSEVQVRYLRGDEEISVPVQLRDAVKPNQGYLGVSTSQERLTEIRATWSAPIVGVGTTVQLTGETFKGLGTLLANLGEGIASRFSGDDTVRKAGDQAIGEAANSVSGPVGILGVIFPAMQQAGIKTLLLLTGIISLSLAVMNALPIPALDGGRWFTMTVFRLLKRPLTKEREEKIQTIGFVALLGLIVLVTIADVGKIIG
jgi:regulator of sigma E protease